MAALPLPARDPFLNAPLMKPYTLLIGACLACGCGDSPQTVKQLPKPPAAKQPRQPAQVGEFDPNGDRQEASSDLTMSNPITGPLEIYQPLKQQVVGMGIDHAVQLFHALEGRYPKDLDEFMTRVIQQNNIKLPPLGPGKSYEYDVENHKLLIVEDKPAANAGN